MVSTSNGPDNDNYNELTILKFPHQTEALVKPMLSAIEKELYEIIRSPDPDISKVYRIYAIICQTSAQAASLACIDQAISNDK
jgi:hypothetical protein